MHKVKNFLNINILFLEESLGKRFEIEHAFKDTPYQLFLVKSISEAIQSIENNNLENGYDILIFDMKPTNINGKNLLNLIKKKSSSTKIIVYTNFQSETEKNAYINLGFNYVLNKAQSLDQLKTEIFSISHKIIDEFNKKLLSDSKVISKNDVLKLKDDYKQDILINNNSKKIITLKDIHFLIVDYSKSILDGIANHMRDQEINVDCVDNGVIALLKLEEKIEFNYDLILLDVNMPFINGSESLNAIRAIYPNLKIYAHTYGSDNTSREHYLSQGFDDVIFKIPFSILKEILIKIAKQIVLFKNVEIMGEDLLKNNTELLEINTFTISQNNKLYLNEHQRELVEFNNYNKEFYDKLFNKYLLLQIKTKELENKVDNLNSQLLKYDHLKKMLRNGV